jgi:alpha-glucosidase
MPILFRLPLILVLAFGLLSPAAADDDISDPRVLRSPDGRLKVSIRLDAQGRPAFEVTYREVAVAAGLLGLEFAGSGPLVKNLKEIGVRRESRDETYAIAVGKASSARDHHRELVISLEEASPAHRRLDLAFRAFDDGVAFRYLIPQQTALADFILTAEQTQLTFSGDPTAHALPLNSFTTSYETHYQTTPVSAITSKMLLGLPLLLEYAGARSKPIWLAVTEANLTDYAGMYLAAEEGRPGTLAARLSPLPGRNDGAKVLGKAPHASPWRVLMIADDPRRLIESHLVFHLSDPPAIKDTSWIKPGKTTFPWWNGYVLEGVDFKPGVNTATMKHYIDFCAEHGIPYHSLDGLDIAWYGGPIAPNGPTDITKAAPSIDLPELLRYAKEKGVRLRLWMHWKALKPQIDEAFRLYETWGIEGVMVDFMDRDDQEMVRFYHEMVQKAARRHLTLTLHGAYKPTGMERTWPNVLSYEAALNQEYNKWDRRGTTPKHNLDIAFIRMLAGPLDYHQGGMRSVLSRNYRPQDKAPSVQGTRGHQLAMYVVYQNHLSMVADYPAAYRRQPGLDFAVNVPANWDETRVLHAEMGRCLVIARRKENDWYVGGMTANEPRKLNLPLNFLGDSPFAVELYHDDPAGNPNFIVLRKQIVSASDSLRVVLPAEGGFAARLTRIVP